MDIFRTTFPTPNGCFWWNFFKYLDHFQIFLNTWYIWIIMYKRWCLPDKLLSDWKYCFKVISDDIESMCKNCFKLPIIRQKEIILKQVLLNCSFYLFLLLFWGRPYFQGTSLQFKLTYHLSINGFIVEIHDQIPLRFTSDFWGNNKNETCILILRFRSSKPEVFYKKSCS